MTNNEINTKIFLIPPHTIVSKPCTDEAERTRLEINISSRLNLATVRIS